MRECEAVEKDHFRTEIRENPESNKREWWASCDTAALAPISLTLGDGLHNLRCALDHIYRQLVIAHGHAAGGNFPFKVDARGYKKQRQKVKQAVGTQALAVVDSLKPYQGGNELLWALHHLDTQDKHNLLVPVGNVVRGVMGRASMADFTKPTADSPFTVGTMSRYDRRPEIGPIGDEPTLVYDADLDDVFAQDVSLNMDLAVSDSVVRDFSLRRLPEMALAVKDAVERLAATVLAGR
jgi:hypothetical protein